MSRLSGTFHAIIPAVPKSPIPTQVHFKRGHTCSHKIHMQLHVMCRICIILSWESRWPMCHHRWLMIGMDLHYSKLTLDTTSRSLPMRDEADSWQKSWTSAYLPAGTLPLDLWWMILCTPVAWGPWAFARGEDSKEATGCQRHSCMLPIWCLPWYSKSFSILPF